MNYSLEVKVDGAAAKGDEAIEVVVLAAHGLSIAIVTRKCPVKEGLQEYAYQVAPEPTPTTLRGLQVRPTGTVAPWRTMPRRLRTRATAPELDCWTLLQHWTGL